jgi:hypothetical protein
MKLDRFQEGEKCHLVFKAQPFIPTPNPEKQRMDMHLNIFSGKYHGMMKDSFERAESFLFETQVNNTGESIIWEVDIDSVLMAGTVTNSSDISRS